MLAYMANLNHSTASIIPRHSTKKTAFLITVTHSDGIGPEIMSATQRILKATGAASDIGAFEVLEKVHLTDKTSGIPVEKWNSKHQSMITNRGVKVWPEGNPATYCTDHWRCRFKSETFQISEYQQVLNLLFKISWQGFDVIKTENLYLFDGEPGFTLGQGQ